MARPTVPLLHFYVNLDSLLLYHESSRWGKVHPAIMHYRVTLIWKIESFTVMTFKKILKMASKSTIKLYISYYRNASILIGQYGKKLSSDWLLKGRLIYEHLFLIFPCWFKVDDIMIADKYQDIICSFAQRFRLIGCCSKQSTYDN